MKKLLAFATALSGFLAFVGSASAADVTVDPGYDWTGPYIGLQAGYGWGDTQPTFAASTADVNYDGFIGGIEAGYNWQSNNFVFGIEIDGSFSDINGDELGVNTPCVTPGEACSADVDWLATGRLRMGYAIDRLMPFITGGLAVGGVDGTFDFGACTCDVDDTTVGWTVGGGIEWAIDDSWSVKAEYLYVDLGKPSISGTNTFVGTDNYDFSIARLGVNFSF